MTEISKQDAILKLKQWTKNNYPDFYFQRINRRQQELDYVMVKYRRYAVTFYSFIFLPLLILWLLAFYQMAYMSHLPMFNFFKITMEFLLTLLNYFHLTIQSERLNSCNERIAQAITQCSWYNCSPAMRKKIGVFVNSVRRSRRLCLLGNSVRLSKPNLLRILRMAFSFVNFMRIENRL
ncbi:uncharacterized protein LOC103514635 [Diaphorina citri]|uniref:Uncharacterized protein LOC103514635 n=1 Tax=Diaphorina citri TaxID=121845 RepID=A0A3Q0J4J9_DIACI|nr:uncharacterized protein LOC103514635 [Diaphorina citri]